MRRCGCTVHLAAAFSNIYNQPFPKFYSIRAQNMKLVADRNLFSSALPLLKATYIERIAPLLMEEFNYKNLYQVPKIEKVVVKCGVEESAKTERGLGAAMNDLTIITGQRPMVTRLKRALANSKIREGHPTGIACTLRGSVMYSFLDRLVNMGDFQGVVSNSFGGNGSYRIGFRELSAVFPDLSTVIFGKPMGMDVSIETTAKTDEETRRLLALMGMPFEANGGVGPTSALHKKKLLKGRRSGK